MEGTSGETMREPQRGAETPSPPAVGQAAREVCRDFLKVSGLYFSRVLTRRCGRVPERRLTLLFLFVCQGACFRENCRYAHDAAEGTVVPAQVRGFIKMRAHVFTAQRMRVWRGKGVCCNARSNLRGRF